MNSSFRFYAPSFIPYSLLSHNKEQRLLFSSSATHSPLPHELQNQAGSKGLQLKVGARSPKLLVAFYSFAWFRLQLTSNIENEQHRVWPCTAFLWDNCTLFGAPPLLTFKGQQVLELGGKIKLGIKWCNNNYVNLKF